jgi:hypothetical protein
MCDEFFNLVTPMQPQILLLMPLNFLYQTVNILDQDIVACDKDAILLLKAKFVHDSLLFDLVDRDILLWIAPCKRITLLLF